MGRFDAPLDGAVRHPRAVVGDSLSFPGVAAMTTRQPSVWHTPLICPMYSGSSGESAPVSINSALDAHQLRSRAEILGQRVILTPCRREVVAECRDGGGLPVDGVVAVLVHGVAGRGRPRSRSAQAGCVP